MAVEDDKQITRGFGRRVQARRSSGKSFDQRRRNKFLRHFAATCNVTAAARVADVAVSTVYGRRSADPAFRAAWAVAQDQGYAALEATLVQRAIDSAAGVVPDESALEDNYRVPFKEALLLLQQHARSIGREPGDVIPRRSDLGEATRRLEAVLKRLGVAREVAGDEQGR